MTDVPPPAAPEKHPPGRPPQRVASRPDLRLCLLEAIQMRDSAQTRRLAERWVHRRGLVALEAFQRITLVNLEGPEACRWLQEQLRLDPPPPLGMAAAAAMGSLPAIPAAPEPISSVEEAFAALAAEFSAPAAPLSPSAADLETIAALGLDQPDAALLPPPLPVPPLSFAISGPVETGPFETGPVDAGSGDQPLPEDAHEARSSRNVPSGRFSFRRVRSLMRDCLEEAMGSLGVAAATSAPLAAPDSAALPAPPSASEEPLAPPPTFHPTASILAALPEPVVPPEPEPGLPRWLPRLGLPTPSRRPAPAPADLADLRAWLPDDEDLPRAC